MSRLHDAVAYASTCDQHRTRKSREHRVRTLDEDAVVTGGCRCASEIEPVRGRSSSHDQPCSATGYRFEHVSNGHTSTPNRGFESNVGVVGVSFYFE